MKKIRDEYLKLFLEDDVDLFKSACADYLDKDAHQIRNWTAAEYVKTCRELWNECELDEVFTFKILLDTNIYTGEDESYKKMGLERHDIDPIKEDLYCTAVGAINEDGKYVGASENYDPTPKNPKSKRGAVVLSPSHYSSEEPAEPTIEEYIVAYFDILGFETTFNEYGIDEMHRKYQSLIAVALKPFAADNLWTKTLAPIGEKAYVPGMFQFPIRYAYFSDSLLLWIKKDASLFPEFLGRCGKVFCSALQLSMPLRGAITVGKQIMHNKSNTYLGAPLIEAARLETAQNWIGLSLGKSFTAPENSLPIHPAYVRIFETPVKEGKQILLSGLVLDWTNIWNELYKESPVELIESMKKVGFEKYYDNTIEFYKMATNDKDWFMNLQTTERHADGQ